MELYILLHVAFKMNRISEDWCIKRKFSDKNKLRIYSLSKQLPNMILEHVWSLICVHVLVERAVQDKKHMNQHHPLVVKRLHQIKVVASYCNLQW